MYRVKSRVLESQEDTYEEQYCVQYLSLITTINFCPAFALRFCRDLDRLYDSLWKSVRPYVVSPPLLLALRSTHDTPPSPRINRNILSALISRKDKLVKRPEPVAL
jgi:hypothetical protein